MISETETIYETKTLHVNQTILRANRIMVS